MFYETTHIRAIRRHNVSFCKLSRFYCSQFYLKTGSEINSLSWLVSLDVNLFSDVDLFDDFATRFRYSVIEFNHLRLSNEIAYLTINQFPTCSELEQHDKTKLPEDTS